MLLQLPDACAQQHSRESPRRNKKVRLQQVRFSPVVLSRERAGVCELDLPIQKFLLLLYSFKGTCPLARSSDTSACSLLLTLLWLYYFIQTLPVTDFTLTLRLFRLVPWIVTASAHFSPSLPFPLRLVHLLLWMQTQKAHQIPFPRPLNSKKTKIHAEFVTWYASVE